MTPLRKNSQSCPYSVVRRVTVRSRSFSDDFDGLDLVFLLNWLNSFNRVKGNNTTGKVLCRPLTKLLLSQAVQG